LSYIPTASKAASALADAGIFAAMWQRVISRAEQASLVRSARLEFFGWPPCRNGCGTLTNCRHREITAQEAQAMNRDIQILGLMGAASGSLRSRMAEGISDEGCKK